MRELDITQIFFARAIRRLRETPAEQITILHIAIGEISELDPISIQTHWDELIKGTSAEQAEIQFRLIPAEVQCMGCFQKYQPLNKKILCPYCGSVGAKILTGEECYLESIETKNE
jgi:hydrogenase nickel incorporation protein HypA/HybF